MSQETVYNFLKQNKGKEFTAKDLINALDQESGSIYDNLKRLEKSKTIKVGKIIVTYTRNHVAVNGKIKKMVYNKPAKVYWI